MELYDRIKIRREELNLSQEDLACKMGYKDRSTIAKIEGGINDITQSKIVAFASCLETTPAYLMGWTDDAYDYELDPDNRFAEIPTMQYEALDKKYANDLEAMWQAWCSMGEEAYNNSLEKAPFELVQQTPLNPDIRMIARAGKKMTPEQAENLRKYAQYMFPEAFEDDNT